MVLKYLRSYKSISAIIVFTFVILISQGCASIKSRGEIVFSGEANPDREAKIINNFNTNNNYETKKNIKVLIDQIPEGLEFKDGVISVSESHNHSIIGKFSVTSESNPMLLKFSNYRNQTDKFLAYPQVVLNYATLFIWSVFIPTAWPFFGSITGKSKKQDIIQDAKQLADLSDGNLIIASYIGPEGENAFGITGWVIKYISKLNEIKIKSQAQFKEAI